MFYSDFLLVSKKATPYKHVSNNLNDEYYDIILERKKKIFPHKKYFYIFRISLEWHDT